MLYVDALTFSIVNVMTSAQLTCNILTLDKSRVLQTFPRFKFLSLFYFFSSQISISQYELLNILDQHAREKRCVNSKAILNSFLSFPIQISGPITIADNMLKTAVESEIQVVAFNKELDGLRSNERFQSCRGNCPCSLSCSCTPNLSR